MYDSHHDKADMAVWTKDTNLVNMEVNSSPLLQMLYCVVKAHNIRNDQVGSIGFALSKLEMKGLLVKVKVD